MFSGCPDLGYRLYGSELSHCTSVLVQPHLQALSPSVKFSFMTFDLPKRKQSGGLVKGHMRNYRAEGGRTGDKAIYLL